MSKALASVEEMIKNEIANVEKTVSTSATMERIKAKNKAFILPGEAPVQKPIEVIVVEFTNNYAYFDGPYNPNSITPPLCVAMGKNIDEMKPKASSEEPQSENCSTCQWNQYETAYGGGKGKRCTQSVTLAVLPPSATGAETPMLLSVPAASITAWGNYVKDLAGKQRVPAVVVTEISFDPKVDYTRFQFKAISDVKDAAAMLHKKTEVYTALHS